jgi:methyl-accepting chemotaxis protein
MSAASNDLTNNLDKAMSRTYQEIDRQLAEIVRHLSGTIADIRDVTEQLPKILASSAAQTQKTTEQYLSTISDSQKQLVSEIKRHNQTPNNRGEK